MKTLTKIEILLTCLVAVYLVALMQADRWLSSMKDSDPTRLLWESRLATPGDILFYVTFLPWVAFSVLYVIALFVYLGAWTFHGLTNEKKS